jgi:hypothetical protein
MPLEAPRRMKTADTDVKQRPIRVSVSESVSCLIQAAIFEGVDMPLEAPRRMKTADTDVKQRPIRDRQRVRVRIRVVLDPSSYFQGADAEKSCIEAP